MLLHFLVEICDDIFKILLSLTASSQVWRTMEGAVLVYFTNIDKREYSWYFTNPAPRRLIPSKAGASRNIADEVHKPSATIALLIFGEVHK